jgi:hypothetical protein
VSTPRPLIDKWEEYFAYLNAQIAGELDENTKRELRYAFISGAVAGFSLLNQAHATGEFKEMWNHLASEGVQLLKEINATPRLYKM